MRKILIFLIIILIGIFSYQNIFSLKSNLKEVDISQIKVKLKESNRPVDNPQFRNLIINGFNNASQVEESINKESVINSGFQIEIDLNTGKKIMIYKIKDYKFYVDDSRNNKFYSFKSRDLGIFSERLLNAP